MDFAPWFDTVERIQLLQRWILVMCYAYYEMNDNISSDYNYDQNCIELFDLEDAYPKAYACSRYADIFVNFKRGCTSGFDLLETLKKLDPGMYDIVRRDAAIAVDRKKNNP